MVSSTDANTTNSDGISCPFCLENHCQEKLIEHFDLEHSKEIGFECTFCESTISGGLCSYLYHYVTKHSDCPIKSGLGKLKRPLQCNGEANNINGSEENDICGENNVINCPFCKINIDFKTKSSFELHVMGLHKEKLYNDLLDNYFNYENKSFKFIDALNDFINSLLENYLVCRENEIFKCIFCQKFWPSNYFENHLREAHGVNEFYLCNYCNLFFLNVNRVKKHIESSHPTEFGLSKVLEDKINKDKIERKNDASDKAVLEITVHDPIDKDDYNILVNKKSIFNHEETDQIEPSLIEMSIGEIEPSLGETAIQNEVKILKTEELLESENKIESLEKIKIKCPICKLDFVENHFQQHLDKVHCKNTFLEVEGIEFEDVKNKGNDDSNTLGDKHDVCVFFCDEDTNLIEKSNKTSEVSKKKLKVMCQLCKKPILKSCIKKRYKEFHTDSKWDESKYNDISSCVKDKKIKSKFPYVYKDKCPECNQVISKYYLKKHIDTVHRKIKIPRRYKNEVICIDCGITFPKSAIGKHVKETHPERVKSKVKYKDYLKMLYPTARRNDDVDRKCPFCNKCVKSIYLNEHCYLHTREKTFQCNICQETFTKWTHLNTHKINTHNLRKEKNFECKECGIKFKSRYEVRIHTEGVHLQKSDHLCDLCGKSFKYKPYLTIHRNSHFGFKAYQCKICEKRFMGAESCRKHVVKVHKIVIKTRLNDPANTEDFPYRKLEMTEEFKNKIVE